MVIVTFCLLHVVAAYYRVEVAPVLLWGHYSQAMLVTNTYEKPIIIINGKEFMYTRLPFFTRELLVLPILYFYQLDKNNYIDPIQERALNKLSFLDSNLEANIRTSVTNSPEIKPRFTEWFKVYLESILKIDIQSLSLYIGRFTFTQAGGVNLLEKDLICTYEVAI